MTKVEHLAAARANLAPALRSVRPSPESQALSHVIEAVGKSESAPSAEASAPKASPLKRVPLGKAK